MSSTFTTSGRRTDCERSSTALKRFRSAYPIRFTPLGAQVVRVHLLREVSAAQRDEIRAGFRERDGRVELCRVNVVYLAPVSDSVLGEEMFADLRANARVPLSGLRGARLAAMTHNARVALLRRDTYFRYRCPSRSRPSRAWNGTASAATQRSSGPRPTCAT